MSSFFSGFLLLVLFSATGFSATHSATYVSCKSLDTNADFTLEFFGHATETKTIKVNFRSPNGTLLHSWSHSINGVASRGFIKIIQKEKVGPYAILITSVLSKYNPLLPVNTSFEAIYRQQIQTHWNTDAEVIEYRLSCFSPY